MDIKNEYRFVTEGFLANEALARSQINDLLIICIGEEKRLALQEYRSNTTPSIPCLLRPFTISSDPAPLLLQFETKLKRLVTFKKEKHVLQGIADYSLWYDKEQPIGTNLILIETKRQEMLFLADGQLLDLYERRSGEKTSGREDRGQEDEVARRRGTRRQGDEETRRQASEGTSGQGIKQADSEERKSPS